jgi:hypothetical protein
MIELPLTKVWTGDGYGPTNAQTLTQVKRSVKNAIYKVTDSTGIVKGYEVFRIKVVPKGTDIYGTILEDDQENYPAKGSFSKTAWYIASLDRAIKRFEELESDSPLNQNDHPEDSTSENESTPPNIKRRKRIERAPLVFPAIEFTMQDLATLNKIEYHTAANMFKEANVNSRFVISRKVKSATGRGKPTNVYIEATK